MQQPRRTQQEEDAAGGKEALGAAQEEDAAFEEEKEALGAAKSIPCEIVPIDLRSWSWQKSTSLNGTVRTWYTVGDIGSGGRALQPDGCLRSIKEVPLLGAERKLRTLTLVQDTQCSE